MGLAYLNTQLRTFTLLRANVATFLNNTCYFDSIEIMSALNVNANSILQDISVKYFFNLFYFIINAKQHLHLKYTVHKLIIQLGNKL